MNIIPREIRIRGKPYQLSELADVVAVRSDVSAQSDSVQGLVPTEVLSQLLPFEKSGWQIVPRAAAKGEDRPRAGAKVYLKQNGQLAVGTGRLTVRLKPDLSEEQARTWFDGHDLRIVNKLNLASNLFVVSPLHDDATAVARKLSNLADIEFAEPEFVEAIGHR